MNRIFKIFLCLILPFSLSAQDKRRISKTTPQVANLAAKMLAIKPHLAPETLIDLIIKNSDKNTEGYPLMNPKKTIKALKTM